MKLVMEEWEKGETSECSSGCQSGWTMYLDQSNDKHPTSHLSRKLVSAQEEEEEEEDQSMVSDASSGPPHFHDEEEHYCDDGSGCFCSAPPLTAPATGGKRRRFEAEGRRPTKPEPSSFLDDTASSPLLSFSKASFHGAPSGNKLSVEDVLEFSCGFSATHFKGKSVLRKHLGYLQSPSPVKPAGSARPVIYAGMRARRRHGDGSHPPLF